MVRLRDDADGASHEENRRLVSPEERYGARLGKRSSAAVLQGRLVERERRNLDEALRQIETDGSALRVTALVVAARRRFVIGTGKSFAYASLLAGDLSAGLSQVTLIDGAIVRPLDVLTEVRNSDVLIAFSVRSSRLNTIDVSQRFRAAGGTVVAVTDEPDAPICAIATESIVVSTDSVSYADSPTAIAAVIHVLSTLATASAKGARRRLAERDRLSRALNTYYGEG
jgi:DNA-binding MurR/RpiR family transcriptional regulator